MGTADHRMTRFQEQVFRTTAAWLGGAVTVAHRLSHGRVGDRVPSGARVCLLTTTGRRSGRRRTVPVVYLPHRDVDGTDELVVVASNGGMAASPAWAHNLRAQARATVERGGQRVDVVAREATGDERGALWAAVVAVEPHFAAYEARAQRTVAVFVLRPTGPAHESPVP